MAGVPKLALDFLLRPATMTPSPAFRYQALHKTGKTRSATAAATAAREGGDMACMAQCLLCEECALFCAEICHSTLEVVEHQQMIVETTCCARENVRMR